MKKNAKQKEADGEVWTSWLCSIAARSRHVGLQPAGRKIVPSPAEAIDKEVGYLGLVHFSIKQLLGSQRHRILKVVREVQILSTKITNTVLRYSFTWRAAIVAP